MGKKLLMKGNEAIGEAAIKAGCRLYFGYPITPQSEIPAYLSKRLPEEGGVYLQAETECSAINMVYGAGGCGSRVMTSSSSPGISLKLEGISYLAGSEVPAVIVNIMRAGPGLGTITPEQADYFQAVKGGGHGNYRLLVLAPASVQEMADLTMEAFDLTEKYRNPVMVVGEGNLGQMMEPVEFKEVEKKEKDFSSWATTGAKGRGQNLINSIHLASEDLEAHNLKLDAKYQQMKKEEVRYEEYKTDDAEIIIVAYGIVSRISKSAIDECRKNGIKVGLLRPITLFPFPEKIINEIAGRDHVKDFLAVELSTGQMVEDVKLSVNGKKPVNFYGRCGGVVITTEELVEQIEKLNK